MWGRVRLSPARFGFSQPAAALRARSGAPERNCRAGGSGCGLSGRRWVTAGGRTVGVREALFVLWPFVVAGFGSMSRATFSELCANTPQPHQVLEPPILSHRVRGHPKSRFKHDILASDPVRISPSP